MTPDTLRALRKRHGLTQQRLADLMGTTRNTVTRWEMGIQPINEGWVRLAFETLDLRAQLHEMLSVGREGNLNVSPGPTETMLSQTDAPA